MSDPDDKLRDPVLDELSEDGAGVDALSAALAGAAVEPPASLRDRVLAGATAEGRYERFVLTACALLDLDAATIRALFDRLDAPQSWEPSPLPRIDLYHLPAGPSAQGAITGLVRIPSGVEFPQHTHRGDEAVLVIQGSCVDGVTGAIARPGDVVRMPAGSSHSLRARPGPRLVYLAVVHTGVEIGGQAFGPESL